MTLPRTLSFALSVGLTVFMAMTGQAAGKKSVPAAGSAKKHARAADTSTGDVSWKPDAALLSKLQSERQFAGISLRIPFGFTVESQSPEQSPNGQITQFLVRGPARPDGTFLAIFITTGIAGPGFQIGSTDALLAGNDVINGKDGLIKSEPQDGQIGGLSVTRQYYKFPVGAESRRWIHGFCYATTDGHTDAMVAAMDADPYNSASLPLAEAVAMTMHKTP